MSQHRSLLRCLEPATDPASASVRDRPEHSRELLRIIHEGGGGHRTYGGLKRREV